MNAHSLKAFSSKTGRPPSRRRWFAAALLVATSSLASAAGPGSMNTAMNMAMERESRTEGLLLRESATAPMPHDVYHRGSVIDKAELAQMRGGFNISGMKLHFGVKMQSLIESPVGNMQLDTLMNLTQSGPKIVSQTLTDSTGKATSFGPDSGTSVVDITPQGINLEGLANFAGVALNHQGDFTAVLHNVTRQAILSGVVSNASGQNIHNMVDIEIHVGNLPEMRAAKQRGAIMRSLQQGF
jgi:hypothetical protein